MFAANVEPLTGDVTRGRAFKRLIERVDCGKLEAGKPDRKEVSARLPVR